MGQADRLPTGAARCRRSPSGPARWPGWWSSCCSARGPAPTSCTVSNGPFDLAALLRASRVAFRPLSDKHTLAADIPDELPPAYGDPMATDIIVGQLLENAFKYSPDGGAVTVRARLAGDGIEVTVEDEGIGIPAEDRERIFERFVQGETGDRRRFGGIGLGLYIVRQLARAQGGEVAAEERHGGGTIMRLRLRLAALADQQDGAEPAPQAGKADKPDARQAARPAGSGLGPGLARPLLGLAGTRAWIRCPVTGSRSTAVAAGGRDVLVDDADDVVALA